jgi:WD40 repeat protein
VTKPTVRVFISSPSDVEDERQGAAKVIERLNGVHGRHVTLEAILWEQQVYDANRSFQEQIAAMQDMDLVIGILWKRIGSELAPARFRREDGSAYESGTVFELEAGLACDGCPPVYVFKKTAPIFFNKETVDEEMHQAALLDLWWDRTFHDADRHYVRGFEPFGTPGAFEQRLTSAIEDWLDAEGLVPRGPIWDITKSTPYPGLRAYDGDRTSVFFGRDLAIGEAVELLHQNINRQDRRPVLVVIGASGSGKSSVARAGIVPRLMTPGIVSGAAAWKTVIVEPTGDVIHDLASQLYKALPVLASSPETSPQAWQDRVLAQPQSAGSTIDWALKQVVDGDRPPKLLVLLDQLETLIADSDYGPFAAAVRSMVEHAGVWLVATLRSDRYTDLQTQRDLLALKRSGTVYDLPPPGKAEIREIVRGPARAAGLVLEEANERSLAQELAEAVPSADSLPLLQVSMARLFDEREGKTLTLASFDAMGGVNGAIAAHADGVFASLSSKARQELLPLVSALTRDVTRRPDGSIGFTAKVANGKTFGSTPARQELVGAFVNGRLIVRDAKGNLRIAHEAVLRHWRKSVDCLEAITDAELRKARLRQMALAAATVIFLLVAGLAGWFGWSANIAERVAQVNLAQAKKSAVEARANESRALVALSEIAYEKSEYIDSVKLALAAWPRSLDDTRPMLQAALNKLGKAYLAQQQILPSMRHEGGVQGAVFNADESRILTWSEDGTARLWNAATAKPIGDVMRHEGSDSAVKGAIFNADESRILTWSNDGTARLWNATTTQPIGEPMRHDNYMIGAIFIADDSRILTWSWDGTARLWDTATTQPIGDPMRRTDSFDDSPIFNADGSRVLTLPHDETALLFDTSTGDLVLTLRHNRVVSGAIFNRRGNRILTWTLFSELRLWDAATGHPIGETMRHEEQVRGAVFNADGSRILTWSWDGTARFWDAATTQPIGEPMRHDDIAGAVFNTDESRILTWSQPKVGPTSPEDATTRLWDAATTQPIGEPMLHKDNVNGARFNADESRILTWSEDGTARLWDAATTQPIGEPMRHTDDVFGALFNTDESRILTWSRDGTVRLWDATDVRPIGVPMEHENAVLGANFSADDSRILTWSSDGTARIWRAMSAPSIPMHHGRGVVGAVFNGDANRILTWSDDNTARLWDAASGDPIVTLRHERGVKGAVFNRDESRILTWSWDDTARLWNVVTAQPIGDPMRHEGSISGAVFNADESRILTWSDDNTARLWDTETIQPIGEPMRHEADVWDALFSADGSRVLTRSEDNTARLWDSVTAQPIGEPMRHDLGESIFTIYGHGGYKKGVLGTIFNGDGSRILTWAYDHTARLWDAATTQPIGKPMRHEHVVRGAVFNADESHILTWTEDGSGLNTMGDNGMARLWDAATAQPIGEPMRHERDVLGAVFNADESCILTWSGDGTARLWDAATTQPIGEPMRPVNGVLFNANENRILTWSFDGTVRLWDAATTQPVDEPMRLGGKAIGAVVHADESRILTWSSDGTVWLWDVATRQPIGEPMRHEGDIAGAIFVANENRVLTWSEDGTARLWDVAGFMDGNLFESACRRLPDHGLSDLQKTYSMKVTDPICIEPPPIPDWSRVD